MLSSIQRASTAAMPTLRKSSGFSLIEIMVVIVILGILASLVVPKIMSRPEQARIVKVHQDILSIQNALDLYKLDNGTFPTTAQGLLALSVKPTLPPVPDNWQPYLQNLPKDPWGHDYLYRNPGEHGEVDIFTNGPTGQPGGTGPNAVIGNWTIASH